MNGDVDLTRQALERGRSGENLASDTRGCERVDAVCGAESLYDAFNAGEGTAEVGSGEALQHGGDMSEID
jgi:hypothetical protein